MEDQDLRLLWEAYDRKLEKSLSLNYRNMEELQKIKAGSMLKPVKRIKWLAILLGLLWLVFLGFLVMTSLAFSNLFFVVSAGMLFLIYAIAVGVYIKDLVLINQFDHSRTVIEAQQKLAALQVSLLKIVRLLLLSMPLYCTWYITFDWIKNAPLTFWLIQVPIILVFTFSGIWLYRNIDYKNRSRRWFKILFSSPEWTGMIKAKEFLDQIEEYKKEY